MLQDRCFHSYDDKLYEGAGKRAEVWRRRAKGGGEIGENMMSIVGSGRGSLRSGSVDETMLGGSICISLLGGSVES